MASVLQSHPARAIRAIVSDWGELNLGDAAAALTYYAVLSIFPGLIVFLALIGLLGDEDTADSLLRIIQDLAPGSAADTFEDATRSIVTGGNAGFALLFGLAGALYSASGYIGAFTRAANQIYGVEETRPFWRNLPRQFALALALMLLLAVALLGLVLTGPLLVSIGAEVGIGDAVITVFKYVRWPALAVVVVLMFTLLQFVGPNVNPRQLRHLFPGSVLALALWLLASAGFSFYVSNFSSYSSTYGGLAGVIIFLVWLWISNLAVLLGTAFNAKLREKSASDPAPPFRPPEHGKEVAGE